MANFAPFNMGNTLLQGENILNMREARNPNSLKNQLLRTQLGVARNKLANPRGMPTYAKQPFFVRLGDQVKAFQLSDQGGAQEVELPPGAMPAIRGQWQDLGGGLQLLDPYGRDPSALVGGSPDLTDIPETNLQGGNLGGSTYVEKTLPPEKTPEYVQSIEETKLNTRAGVGTNAPSEAEIASERVSAEESARADVKEQVTKKANTKAYKTYQVARNNLSTALQDTLTGWAAGKLPAISASQQVAENAQKILFPAIKSLVREAGEGVFTDRDALDIQAMMPTRGTHPEAIPTIMWQIDSYIASKLGQEPPPRPSGSIQRPAWIADDDPRWNQLSNEQKKAVIEARQE